VTIAGEKQTMSLRTSLSASLMLLTVLNAGCTKTTPVEEISRPAGETGPELPPPAIAPDDWPWWRGPTHNGIAVGDAPVTWSETENVIWKSPIPGRGHSSPTVVGDRVYLATADEGTQTQSMLALDRGTRNVVWTKDLHQGGLRHAMHGNSAHANGTVACDGERLFIAFLHDNAIHLYALTLDGELAWQQQLGAFNSKFGYAPSPTIWKSFVIVAADNQGGGWIAAVHRKTGEVAWRKARPAISTYSSPVVASVAGKEQLLISGCNEVSSFDPETGEALWSCPGTTEATCGTMVWDVQRVVASGGYPGSQTICVDAATGEEVWSNGENCYEQSLLLYDGYVYAVARNGAFCWNAETGSEAWRGRVRGKFSASPVFAGGHIYATNEGGTTCVFKADPAEFELVAENQVGSETFSTLSICGGRIYLRVADHAGGKRQETLYCIGTGT
jgi:outer membrane protein assembly factor BamB